MPFADAIAAAAAPLRALLPDAATPHARRCCRLLIMLDFRHVSLPYAMILLLGAADFAAIRWRAADAGYAITPRYAVFRHASRLRAYAA